MRSVVVLSLMMFACSDAQVDAAAATAAGMAIADAIEAGREVTSVHPDHVRWLVGPGGWTSTDLQILKTKMLTTDTAHEVARLQGRLQPGMSTEQLQETQGVKEWLRLRRELRAVADALRRGDAAGAKQALYDKAAEPTAPKRP